MESTIILLTAAVACGLYLSWSIGANDAANSIGAIVGSKALRIGQAIALASVFEFAGSLLAGHGVSQTIQRGIVDPSQFACCPMQFAQGMVMALLATALWLQFSSRQGIPVSTTHSVVGAVCGFALVALGPAAVHWNVVGNIVASWFVSPVLGAAVAFALFLLVRRLLLQSACCVQALRRYVPILVALVLSVMLPLGLGKSLAALWELWQAVLLCLFVSCVAMVLSRFVLNRYLSRHRQAPVAPATLVEQVFARLQLLTVSFLAFAHGSNDVANAVGPIAAVVHVAQFRQVTAFAVVPWWLLAMGGVGIAVGLATYGRRVVATVGSNITHMTPTRGFCAEFATALITLVGSHLGLPLSSTQVLVGAIVGVGLARGVAGLNSHVIRRIMRSWVFSLPATALLSAALFVVLQFVLQFL
ncbi:MAG: inorganic phosphate transporter [Myxococcota bacterium]